MDEWVYFLRAPHWSDGFKTGTAVKIGRSRTPLLRLSRLQRLCPLVLELAAVIPGGPPEEADLHRMFADERLALGEWFFESVRLAALIDSIGNPFDRLFSNAARARR